MLLLHLVIFLLEGTCYIQSKICSHITLPKDRSNNLIGPKHWWRNNLKLSLTIIAVRLIVSFFLIFFVFAGWKWGRDPCEPLRAFYFIFCVLFIICGLSPTLSCFFLTKGNMLFFIGRDFFFHNISNKAKFRMLNNHWKKRYCLRILKLKILSLLWWELSILLKWRNLLKYFLRCSTIWILFQRNLHLLSRKWINR